MIKFKTLTLSDFNNLTKDPETIYFISDSKQIYKGDELYTTSNKLILDSNNLAATLTDLNSTLNTSITKEVEINLTANSTISDNLQFTKTVDLIINGYKKIIINSGLNFNINAKTNTFNNIYFDVSQNMVITKATEYNNCIFDLKNDARLITNLAEGSIVKFNNCIFKTSGKVISILDELQNGYAQVAIINCIFNNSIIEINSSNEDEFVNLTYATGLSLDEKETNKAIIFNPLDAIFNTVTVIGE